MPPAQGGPREPEVVRARVRAAGLRGYREARELPQGEGMATLHSSLATPPTTRSPDAPTALGKGLSWRGGRQTFPMQKEGSAGLPIAHPPGGHSLSWKVLDSGPGSADPPPGLSARVRVHWSVCQPDTWSGLCLPPLNIWAWTKNDAWSPRKCSYGLVTQRLCPFRSCICPLPRGSWRPQRSCVARPAPRCPVPNPSPPRASQSSRPGC